MPLNSRQQMLAYTTLMTEGDHFATLFRFLPPEEEGPLKEFASKIWSQKKEHRSKDVIQKIKEVFVQKKMSILHEVHPGWIAERLKDESPRVLGVLCRYLPGETVKYLIDHLPKAQAQNLPKINETFAVSSDLILWIKDILEKKFAHPSLPALEERFSFSHIGLMSGKDLMTLFRELGLEEIRKAFSQVEVQSLKVFFSRFSVNDTRELKARILDAPPCHSEEKKIAQQHIVTMELQALSAEALFYEIGFSYFAHAILPSESQWVEAVCERLSPQDGYVLKRFIKEYASKRSEGLQQKFREEILRRIFYLTEKRKIRKYWLDPSEHEQTGSYTEKY
ncbi:MAG: hypothetical protein A3I75_07030 [Deltaproteobacteria bacterium RIFCSPLOWO2_02_FULL_50_16]|nr:MAG: hypothetical protein A2053_00590 [Deltaproteobacteria bacterium GWA2_50_8]OGQ26985.1 MAG: hypothetical protein A3B79_03235 [Deltaproteobacteria bacterium RIFCSPHIGHO2_02_FULL_50_15]OGQ56476.1 MAG: hypothetical protein A3I75_07030 [Deltaproteobacteria bacterium RIFCSPLOWO2_02_FULL_50_16]OGQ68920.1 MAG: hypothetical protein A3F89_02740 [Deltaproteobacteria bacterium RIFCSPLOWO2_12_FULL_50_11]